MTQHETHWRVTYTPGDWTVLAGPTSMVILEPARAQHSDLVDSLWRAVVDSVSITELARRMTGFGIDAMPTFAAFFWAADGMRSLVRGAISVMDLAEGRIVADGVGVQTWTEVGLGGVQHVRIDMQARGIASIELPLVIGAVRASSVVLDARPQSVPQSPQLGPAAEFTAEPAGPSSTWWDPGPGIDASPAAAGEQEPTTPSTQWYPAPGYADDEDADTELMDLPKDFPSPSATEPDDLPPSAPVPGGPGEEMTMGIRCPRMHANPPWVQICRVCGKRIRRQSPTLLPRPVLATVRAPDGSTVDVDRPVLIGRAPSSDPSDGPEPRLVTVVSRGQDISRTHLRVAPAGWEVVVTDLNSTNGTTLLPPGGGTDAQPLPPGEAVPVAHGSILDLGDGVRVAIEAPQDDR